MTRVKASQSWRVPVSRALINCKQSPKPALKGFVSGSCRRVIEEVMKNLKGTAAEGRVSYADLIALGGAYAVSVTGGPTIAVPIGQLHAHPFATLCRLLWYKTLVSLSQPVQL